MIIESSAPERLEHANQIKDLIRSLAATEAALEAALPAQVDAVINPATATPILLHRAQAALQMSEARYRHLVSRMAAIVFELDPGGTILYVNDAVQQATDYSAQELLGKNWWETFFPGEQQRQVKVLYAQLRHGDVSNYQLTLTTRSGSSITLELNTANRYAPDGTVQQFLGLGVNITERKRADEQVHFQAHLLNTVGQAVITVDLLGTVIYWNRFAEMLYGWTAPEALGRPILELVHNNTSEGQAAEITFHVMKGESWTGEFPVQRRDGSIFAALVTYTPVYDDHGTLMSIIGVSTDITDRKRVEEGLRASEGRYRRLFESAQDGILILEANTGLTIDVNPFLADLLGYRHDEFLGKKLWEIGPFKDAQQLKAAFKELQDKQYIRYESLPLETKDGRSIDVEFVSNCYHADGRTVIQCNIRDITERRKAEEVLRQSEERFAVAFRLSPVGIALTTAAEGRYIDLNESLLKLLGYSREEMIGRTSEELNVWVAPEQRVVAAQSIRQYGSVHGMEVGFRTKSGEIRITLTSIELVVLNGQSCFLSMIYDINERKQAEEVLTRERILLRTLIDAIPDHIYVKDTESRFVLSNFALTSSLAIAPDALIGKTDYDFYPRDTAIKSEADDQAIFQSGQPKLNREEISLDQRTGNVQWLLTTKVPLFNSAGNITGLVGIGRDVTERNRLAEAEHEQRLIAETLASVTLALTSQLSLEAVLDEILRQAQRLVPHSASQIGMLEGNILRPVRWQGYERFSSGKFVAGLAQELADFQRDVQAIPFRKAVIISDAQADAHWKVFEETAWIRSSIIAPICLQDRVLGELELDSDTPNRFTTADAARLQPLISAAAIALENARLFGQAEEEIAERKRAEQAEREQRMLAEALRSTAAALTSTLDPDVVMVRILDSLDKVVRHDFANIMLIEQNIARAVHRHGYSPDVDKILESHQFAVNELPYLHKMRVSGRPCLLADTHAEPDWVNPLIHELYEVRSYIGVPIMAREQVIGFLNLESLASDFFTLAHIERLQAFADQAAVAFENAQLYNKLYKHATDLEERVVERTAALSRAKDHVEAILYNSSDAIVVTDIEGLIEQNNPAFRSLFVYQSGEALGHSVVTLAVSAYRDRLLETFRHVVNDVQSAQIEITASRRGGTFFEAEVAISPIVGPDGVTTSVVFSVRDISVYKRIEKELQELNHLKTELLSTAAHELRTPLTSIRGFSEILLTRELDFERQQRYLRLISEQSTQLGQLIDDLLDISRLEAQRGLSLNLESMNIDELLHLVSAPFIESAPHHQISFEHQADGSPLLIGDSFRLAQVIKNLLSNAVKYSPNGGMITVRCETFASEVTISVQDHGIGLTSEQQIHLFEKFYRADTSNTAIGGTGLGLAISKVIIELHGGRIWFESAFGIGTTFYFTLLLS